MMWGAASAREMAINNEFDDNDALKYAAIRNILHRKGKSVEILANYEPGLHYVSEWWKQLYGESEGKDQKGIFPASVDLTTDLHSMGQFIQDGSRIMYETVLNVEESQEEIIIGEEPVDLDGLNYLAGKNVDFVNKSAMNGTILPLIFRHRMSIRWGSYSICLSLPVVSADISPALIRLISRELRAIRRICLHCLGNLDTKKKGRNFLRDCRM